MMDRGLRLEISDKLVECACTATEGGGKERIKNVIAMLFLKTLETKFKNDNYEIRAVNFYEKFKEKIELAVFLISCEGVLQAMSSNKELKKIHIEQAKEFGLSSNALKKEYIDKLKKTSDKTGLKFPEPRNTSTVLKFALDFLELELNKISSSIESRIEEVLKINASEGECSVGITPLGGGAYAIEAGLEHGIGKNMGQCMTKLLETKNEIKTILINYFRLISGRPIYDKKEFINEPFDVKLSRCVDQYIRNMDGFYLFSLPKGEKNKKTYLTVDGMIAEYDSLVHDCVSHLEKVMLFGLGGRRSETVNFCNLFEDLVKREYPFFESIEKRAECAIVFFENRLKRLDLKKFTFFEELLINLSKDLEANDASNIPDIKPKVSIGKKLIDIEKECIPFSKVYNTLNGKRYCRWNLIRREEEHRYDLLGRNDSSELYYDMLNRSTLNCVLMYDEGLFSKEKDLYNDFIKRLDHVEKERKGCGWFTQILFGNYYDGRRGLDDHIIDENRIEKIRRRYGMVKINELDMLYYYSIDGKKYRIYDEDFVGLFSELKEKNKNIKEIADFFPEVHKEYFLNLRDAPMVCLPLIDKSECLEYVENIEEKRWQNCQRLEKKLKNT